MNDFSAIAWHEIVYMYRGYTSDGAALVHMIWHERDMWGMQIKHSAAFPMSAAATMGMDIAPGFILCQPWAMVNAVISVALMQSLGM